MKHTRPILFVAVLIGFPSLVLGCPGYADFRDCTREEVKDGGCKLCPVTCHNYDNEDAGDGSADDASADADASAEDAGDAG